LNSVLPAEIYPVGVEVAGQSYTLCYDSDVTNVADKLCKKAGYR